MSNNEIRIIFKSPDKEEEGDELNDEQEELEEKLVEFEKKTLKEVETLLFHRFCELRLMRFNYRNKR
jgi:hypothetical protein